MLMYRHRPSRQHQYQYYTTPPFTAGQRPIGCIRAFLLPRSTVVTTMQPHRTTKTCDGKRGSRTLSLPSFFVVVVAVSLSTCSSSSFFLVANNNSYSQKRTWPMVFALALHYHPISTHLTSNQSIQRTSITFFLYSVPNCSTQWPCERRNNC